MTVTHDRRPRAHTRNTSTPSRAKGGVIRFDPWNVCPPTRFRRNRTSEEGGGNTSMPYKWITEIRQKGWFLRRERTTSRHSSTVRHSKYTRKKSGDDVRNKLKIARHATFPNNHEQDGPENQCRPALPMSGG